MAQTILIIEDEPGILETIQITLETEGFRFKSAMTGEAGLEALDETIKLVLLDIGLPDQTGFSVLKEIRKLVNTPVILLTARNAEIDKVLGLELGADDYVVKPFSPRELTARIRAILRRTEANLHETKSKPFRLDTKRKIIYYFETSLILSPYEFKTLELFLENPGRIFSREEIMDKVWTEPEDSFDRAVDTVIKNIRIRLKDVKPDLDPIETKRSQGYGLKDKI
ncbi:response regulator [Leptospira sp. 96542]|nr:response regulator [Leptospira sp. 96542]